MTVSNIIKSSLKERCITSKRNFVDIYLIKSQVNDLVHGPWTIYSVFVLQIVSC